MWGLKIGNSFKPICDYVSANDISITNLTLTLQLERVGLCLFPGRVSIHYYFNIHTDYYTLLLKCINYSDGIAKTLQGHCAVGQ